MRLHVGEVRDPETIGRRGHELALNQVTGSALVLVDDSRHFELPAATSTAKALLTYEASHGAVGGRNALATPLPPALLRAVDTVAVGPVDSKDLGFEGRVTLRALAGRLSAA